MNLENSIIYIENGKYSDIKNALKQWIELYLENLDTTLKFKLYKFDRTHTVIELNKKIENEHFNYLINYLTYPENIKYKVLVKGFTIIKDKKIFPKNLLNQQVQIFIPKEDNDFDVVFGAVKSGDTFKIDFGGTTVKTNSEVTYSQPTFEYKNGASETLDINKKEILKTQNNDNIEKFNSRFLYISTLFIAGTLIAGYFTYDTENFTVVIRISSFGLFFWVMLENELLRVNSVYLKLLSISIFLSFVGYYLSFDFVNDVWLKSTKMSLCFLILYKILRYFYLSIYNREPDFDNSANLIVDRIYTIVLLLLLGSELTSMFI